MDRDNPSKPLLKTPSTFPPVTLNQLKKSLKLQLDLKDHDSELESDVLPQAIETYQDNVGYILADSVWTWKIPFIRNNERMPVFNPTAIVEVSYIDGEGNSQTVPDTDYELDLYAVRPVLSLANQSASWPTASETVTRPWTIEYRAGYQSTGEVPAKHRRAVLALASHIWLERQGADFGPTYKALKNRRYATYI